MELESKMKGYEAAVFRDHFGDYREAADMEDSSVVLYAQQDKVPRLPVPDLASSLELFLKSIEPFVTAEELVETKRKAEEFGSGIGKTLQKRLEERAADRSSSSWLQEWWNDLGYLSYRDPVVYNVSYYLQLRNEAAQAMASPCRRAARYVFHALGFRELVVSGSLEPDMRKKIPMSNTQWKFLFNTCRIPAKPKDYVRTYAPDVFRHLVVIRKNRFFSFQVIDQVGNPIPIDAIEQQLLRIVNTADHLGYDPNGVGICTTGHRDTWTDTRELICSGQSKQQNLRAIQRIESAVFILCLDDTKPTTREEIGRALLHSDGTNRFFDKSWQFVFFDNGVGGCIGEHSMMDGLTTTRFLNHVLDKAFADDEEVTKPRELQLPYNGAIPLPEPEICTFDLIQDAKDAISKASRDHVDTMATKELKVLMFHGYGKDKIKTFKCSPDAFAQLAIQLAYYKTFGYVRGTYESTQTRSYLHGRTEVTRSVSSESLAFCKAMTVESAQTSPSQAHQLLLNATKAHSSYIGKASNGLGCDRHLFGLKMLMKEGESAELFQDVAYARSTHWALSTSGLVGELMDGWGFGEVVPDGIGVGYQVQKARLRFTITSRHQWADRICANLEQVLLEMSALCTTFTAPDKAKL